MQAVFSGNGTGILDATAFPVSSYATLPDEESYYAHQLITYIGNKRSFIRPIHLMIEVVKARLGRKKLRSIDLFSGSGVVARLLKGHSNYLVVNDLEDYARVISQCYLANKSQLSHKRLRELLFQLNSLAESGSRLLDPETPPVGFIEELYAPKDEKNLTSDDRVFYTRQNARRLDLYRQGITHLTAECGEYAGYLPYVLAPLLSGASVHTNTAGVFKGFYKNRETKIGQFGGSGADALSRIMGKIMLQAPTFSSHSCDVEVMQQDANEVAKNVHNLDFAYIDPPYNQHPYGSNYFMLNLIANYQRPETVSQVSGIPTNWRRSGYNVRARSAGLLSQLLQDLDARFILLSFNNEGFIPPDEMMDLLQQYGTVERYNIPYTAFRGSRSFRDRSVHVTEQLFLLEKK